MATAAGVAHGGLNPKPKPNPSASRPALRSPGKPVALDDITNTGRPNPPRSISVGNVLRENPKLVQLLAQKIKIIELSRSEINKLCFALHAARQQILHLAQMNTEITVQLAYTMHFAEMASKWISSKFGSKQISLSTELAMYLHNLMRIGIPTDEDYKKEL